ncbi:MAG: hypothetical protein NTY94_19470 [Alphaproteobacteria bacterium]|nr:hypothetical protein [Alphaproteobacteria bacterium]
MHTMATSGGPARRKGNTLRRSCLAIVLVLLAALPWQAAQAQAQAQAQERLPIAPGHTLRLHPAPGPEQPVSARYAVELAAGDWLAVTAPAAIIKGAATEPPLRLTGPGGQEAREFGRLVHRADAAGTRVLEARDFHTLSVARYPAGHPVVEPGVAPEAVRLQPGPLGRVAMAAEPMEPRYDDAPPPSGWPARLAIRVGERMVIHLYRRAALRQMELWPHDPTRNIASLLAGTAPIEAGLYLPIFPVGNDFLAFAAQAERVQGACFTWLRYVGHWAQEEAYPFEQLTYAALGLSQDGQWFAVATAELVPAAVKGQPTEAQDGRSPDYEAALRRAIAENPFALSPRLGTLDAVIASLAPPCGGR